jgi:hypothetical protein
VTIVKKAKYEKSYSDQNGILTSVFSEMTGALTAINIRMRMIACVRVTQNSTSCDLRAGGLVSSCHVLSPMAEYNKVFIHIRLLRRTGLCLMLVEHTLFQKFCSVLIPGTCNLSFGNLRYQFGRSHGFIDLFGYIASPKQEIYNGEEPTSRSRVEKSPTIAAGGTQIGIMVD